MGQKVRVSEKVGVKVGGFLKICGKTRVKLRKLFEKCEVDKTR